MYDRYMSRAELCLMMDAGKSDGLCYRLTRTCPKADPTRYELSKAMKDVYEVSRDSLEKKELLGSGNFGEVWRGVYLQIGLYLFTDEKFEIV